MKIIARTAVDFVGFRRFRLGEVGEVPGERSPEVRALVRAGLVDLLDSGPVEQPTPAFFEPVREPIAAPVQAKEEKQEEVLQEPAREERPIAMCIHCGLPYLEHRKARGRAPADNCGGIRQGFKPS
jgi:hypothetical protein